MRTADTIAAQGCVRGDTGSVNTDTDTSLKAVTKPKREAHPNSLKNLKPYVPGVSGNPGGKPGYDVAAALARAVIEGSQSDAYEGLAAQLAKGNAYTFKELAERGYGKLKEKIEVSGNAELLARLAAGRARAAKK